MNGNTAMNDSSAPRLVSGSNAARTPKNRSGYAPSGSVPAQFASYVPPQDIEAEQATLGAMLIAPEAVDAACALLTRTDFYRPSHDELFDAVVTLKASGKPVDLLTLIDEMRSRDRLEYAGGIPYLTALFDTVPTAANVTYYAAIVREKSLLRQAMEAAYATLDAAHAPSAESGDVLAEASARLTQIAAGKAQGGAERLSTALMRVFDQAEANSEGGGCMTGLATGFTEIDRMTGGLQPADLVILAARPSMGKTSLSMAIAERAALAERKAVVIFSLEMPTDQLVQRLVCSRSEVSSQDFRRGRLEREEWERVAATNTALYDAPMFIIDDTRASPAMMARECRRIAQDNPLSLIVVDYLQLVKSDKRTDNRTQEVGAITNGLKDLAREFRVPVIALSQLSRNVESRENKRPLLSDLRESGEIEAAADLVCFLYREAYYKQKAAAKEGGSAPAPALEETELIFAKHRNGPTGYVRLGFAHCFARFDDWITEADNEPTGF